MPVNWMKTRAGLFELPAAWVTFGGIVKTERYSTSRRKYIATGRFVGCGVITTPQRTERQTGRLCPG